MAINFNIPSSPKKLVYESNTFLGADFTSEASTVDDTKSPNCENMIRSVPGKIRKRMGYEEVIDYQHPIWGVHYYSITDTYLIHAGTKLYVWNKETGSQWEYFREGGEGSKVSYSDLTFFYNTYLDGYCVIECDNTSNIMTYEVSDMYHSNSAATPEDMPAFPIPTLTISPFSNYSYVSAEECTGKIYRNGQEIDSRASYWKYKFAFSAYAQADFVDEEENNIYLLDGFVENTVVANGLAEHKSVSFELGGKLLILDGTKAWLYDQNGLHSMADYKSGGEIVNDVAYIPTVTINKDPVGVESEVGNQSHEALNLITGLYKESFYVSSDHPNSKVFQMSFAPLDNNTLVTVWVMNAQGTWVKQSYYAYTVDYTEGTITFDTAPGASPIEGHDNVIIQACRTVEGYADRINKCTIGAMFGINGEHNRIFVSGNPGQGVDDEGNAFTLINCDWWCEMYDPTYWPDLNYSKLGSDTSAIMGYSIINNYLAAHKDYREQTQSIIIREGDLVDDDPVFKTINSLQGAGAISKYCFSYLATEPVFLTKLGVYAVTAQDITGEKYSQDRSYYLEGKLLKEEGLENAIGFTWRDFYMVAVNNHLYVLDGLQPMHTDKSKPYATRQYAGFYFTNIPATCFFEKDDYLYFGTNTGKIYRFFKDEHDLKSYADAGEAISATWETADISEKLFYKKKTYRYLALRCMPEITSSVQVYAQKQGQWNLLKDDQSKLKYFTYSSLQYSKLSYSTDKTQKISATKIRLKKLDHVRFRFVNDRLYEPLGINDFAVEYTQAGNVK